MSPNQSSILDGWKRPLALMEPRHSNASDRDDALMASNGAFDLVQDITTDCSVVASLCAAMKILTSSVDGAPVSSSRSLF